MYFRKLLFASLNFICIASFAQTFTYLDVGNSKSIIYSDGNLFQDMANSNAGLEIPKNSNKHSIYASAIWLSATSQRNGIPYISSAYETFGNENKFQVGPVDIVNQVGDQSMQFQTLWNVKKSEINNHILNWNNPNYTTPSGIASWPGNGNANTAQNLAPFADLDGDNLYEPQSGEYPIIKGDQAVYLIVNDYRAEDTVFNLGNIQAIYAPLKVEMHLMLYAFNSPIPAISNTIFVEATIYNRSNASIDDHQDLRFSVFADFDLGNPIDDYVGSSQSKNMFYAYNADLFDENFGGNSGYGNRLATQGVKFLDYGLNHAVYYNIGSQWNGDPINPKDFSNYQRGKWRNGNQILEGGDGYNSACVNPNSPVKIMYDGNPNAANLNGEWTEISPCLTNSGNSNAPGDRRMVGGPSVPQQLLHGNSLKVNFAYVFAQDNSVSTSVGSPVGKLFAVADTVQSFFDNTITQVDQLDTKPFEFTIYPNPANIWVQISTKSKNFEIEVLDMKGSVLMKDKNKTNLDFSALKNGIYFVRIKDKGTVQTKKLILSR